MVTEKKTTAKTLFLKDMHQVSGPFLSNKHTWDGQVEFLKGLAVLLV